MFIFKASVGTLPLVHTQEVETQLKALIISGFSDTLGEARISAFDLAAKYSELGSLVETALVEKFGLYGLRLRQFVLENVSLPPEVEAIIDKRSSMGVIGNVDQYLKFNVADKAGEAISQPGSLAGAQNPQAIFNKLGNPEKRIGGVRTIRKSWRTKVFLQHRFNLVRLGDARAGVRARATATGPD